MSGASVAALLLAALAGGCGAGDDPDGATPPAAQPSPTASPTRSPTPAPPAASFELTGDHEVLATGLEIPWDVDFLPDGTALLTERAGGRILRSGPDGDGRRFEVAQQIEGVNSSGEGGLLGIAVSPDYQDDETIFIYHSTGEENRVSRLRLGEQPEPILTGIPHSSNHNGGQLAFGPDGFLYVSTGDSQNPSLAQDRDSLAGKILRMTTDGDPAPDNPFDSLVWAYGLRNVQGLAWDAEQRLWATEFGQDTWDEINLIEPGENYGWPEVEGEGGGDRFAQPAVTWRPGEAACSGAAVVGTTLVAACLRGQRLWLMAIGGPGELASPEPLLTEEYGRLRGASVAPDGSLWITTSNRDGRLPGGPREGDDRIVRLAVTEAD